MNILPILYHLQAVFAGSRQVGHTKFARGIARVGGVLICADEKSAALFARKRDADDTPPQTVSMQDTRAVSRYEAQGVPIVLDNYAVMKICGEAIQQIQELGESLKIAEQLHTQEKLLWAKEMQAQRQHHEARVTALEDALYGFKRIARMFRYAHPAWLDNHLASKRRR